MTEEDVRSVVRASGPSSQAGVRGADGSVHAVVGRRDLTNVPDGDSEVALRTGRAAPGRHHPHDQTCTGHPRNFAPRGHPPPFRHQAQSGVPGRSGLRIQRGRDRLPAIGDRSARAPTRSRLAPPCRSDRVDSIGQHLDPTAHQNRVELLRYAVSQILGGRRWWCGADHRTEGLPP